MQFIVVFINKYGLVAIFVIIMLEYACFPVSSEIVLPFFGAVASASHTNFFLILSLSVLAGLIGTGICFTIGWFGGGAILHSITRRFPKTSKSIDAANARFQQNGGFAVCIGRVIPLVRTYIAFVAGAAKLNPVTYFAASALGITIWNTLLIGLGYIFGGNYQYVRTLYSRYKHNLIPVAVAFAVILIANRIYCIRKRKRVL